MTWSVVHSWWKYVGVQAHVHLEEHADPKVQLEQVITDARDQHRKLIEHAATVIAHQKQAERRLGCALTEYERTQGSARRALVLLGREPRAEHAATSFAARLLVLERQVGELRTTVLDTTMAAEQAKRVVRQSASALRRKLEQREQLVSALDQAEMLEASVVDDDWTFARVQQTVDARLARAQAMAELAG
jgi:phage shock protein A